MVVDWWSDAFVTFHWHADGADLQMVFGHSGADYSYHALYHDVRGTDRLFAMTAKYRCVHLANWLMTTALAVLRRRGSSTSNQALVMNSNRVACMAFKESICIRIAVLR